LQGCAAGGLPLLLLLLLLLALAVELQLASQYLFERCALCSREAWLLHFESACVATAARLLARSTQHVQREHGVWLHQRMHSDYEADKVCT
jgi:hypothetical protein